MQQNISIARKQINVKHILRFNGNISIFLPIFTYVHHVEIRRHVTMGENMKKKFSRNVPR